LNRDEATMKPPDVVTAFEVLKSIRFGAPT
jgi:hypothetical protein